jgi:nucleotide-binding universal stress UspA family protein
MITIRKILIPTDFSEYSRHALQYALALAEGFQAKLFLIHVWELPMTGSILPAEPYPEVILTEEQKARREKLTRLAEILQTSGVEVEPVFVLGKAYLEIVKAAEELEVDVVVLSTHGRSGVSHLLFGSIAEKVVRLASCPVLTVKPPEPAQSWAA